MGTWGPGLWSDDTASDIRSTYREALEDGLGDAEARTKVLTEFSADLADDEYANVVWLALAGVQHSLGRLEADIRDNALEVIDTGSDLLRWEGSKDYAKRKAVLAKLRDQLAGPQVAPKKIRRPARRVTALAAGDVVAYRASSRRYYLLEIQAIHVSRYGSFPFVRLLNYEEERLPEDKQLSKLAERPANPKAQGPGPAPPWWSVDGVVMHKRGHDYQDLGFSVVGRRPALPPQVQEKLGKSPRSYSSWEFWGKYLDKQDEMLGERLAESSGGWLRRRRRS